MGKQDNVLYRQRVRTGNLGQHWHAPEWNVLSCASENKPRQQCRLEAAMVAIISGNGRKVLLKMRGQLVAYYCIITVMHVTVLGSKGNRRRVSRTYLEAHLQLI